MTDIGIDQISPWKLNPRSNVDEESLAELAASIKEVGIIQPIVVRPAHDEDREDMVNPQASYVIVAGERRYKAAVMAELTVVPANVNPMNKLRALEIAIIENGQREDVSAIEEARSFQAYLAEAKISQTAFAEKIGKSQGHVANRLRLLKLPEDVQTSIISGEINATSARDLVKLVEYPGAVESATEQVQKYRYTWSQAIESAGREALRKAEEKERLQNLRKKNAAKIEAQINELRAQGKNALSETSGEAKACRAIYDYEVGSFCDDCERRVHVVGVSQYQDDPTVKVRCPDPQCYTDQKEAESKRSQAERRKEEKTRAAQHAPRKKCLQRVLTALSSNPQKELGADEMRYIARHIIRHCSDNRSKKLLALVGREASGDAGKVLKKFIDEASFHELLLLAVGYYLKDDESSAAQRYNYRDDSYISYLKAKGFQDPNEKPAPAEDPEECCGCKDHHPGCNEPAEEEEPEEALTP
ncbi:MAG: ParB/RepB/Spo0J family partition protein [Candidatus Aquicultorales bacterium]